MDQHMPRPPRRRKTISRTTDLPLFSWTPPPALDRAVVRLAAKYRLPPHTAALVAHTSPA